MQFVGLYTYTEKLPIFNNEKLYRILRKMLYFSIMLCFVDWLRYFHKQNM